MVSRKGRLKAMLHSPPAIISSIPSGRAGVRVTLKIMSQLVRAGKKHPAIRMRAVDLTMNLPPRDFCAEIETVFSFVQLQIRFVQDINGVETLHTAEQVLEQGCGDCDDKSILLASLLESIGHPTRFVACGFERGSLSHVFVDTRVGANTWISLDASVTNPMGWRPPNIVSLYKRDN